MGKSLRIVAAAMAVALLAGCGTGVTNSSTPSTTGTTTTPAPAQVQNLVFYFPVAASGAPGQLIGQFVLDFNKQHKDIFVNAVFAGDYDTTMTKVQTAIGGGQTPDAAILQATDVYTLLDKQELANIDDFVAADKDGKEYLADFYPAFMANSTIDGKTWSVPFQRSTPVLYWNIDMFQKAGFDHAPKTWDELVSMGKKLTAPGVNGYEVPTKGKSYWELQGQFAQNGVKNIASPDGKKVFFNDPKVVEALDAFIKLGTEQGIMPKNVTTDWGAAPADFEGGKAAMIMHTTGSLADIEKKSNFKVGVAFLPAGPAGFGTPTGGGNLYMFKTTPERQKATWTFIRFMTDAAQATKWSISTGYVGTRKSVYDTPEMKDLITKDPNFAVARDQMQYAVPELATHENGKVAKVLNDALAAAILGQKSAKDAMDQAQKDAEAILAPFNK